MAGTDLIHIGGGDFVVRDLYDAWVAAGSPPYNSAGRLVAEQAKAWDAYQNGTGSPADNPARPDLYPLAHVRFAAIDITPTPARVAALSAAGLVRPYAYEPWHWQLRNIYNYPLVYSIPSLSGGGSVAVESSTDFLEDDMAERLIFDSGAQFLALQGKLFWIPSVADGEALAANASVRTISGVPNRIGADIVRAFQRDAGAVLPVRVYVADGNGTVYLLTGGKLKAAADPKTLAELEAKGGPTMDLSQAEVDSLLGQNT